jgi:hypothetical protein
MAIVHEEVVIIKVSKLVKDKSDAPTLITTDIVSALEQVAQELVGDSAIVEVEEAK